jgi:hypothetical protein
MWMQLVTPDADCIVIYFSFVEKLEDFLKPVMLIQLLGSMMAFCVIGFQLSVVSYMTVTK